MKITPFQAIVLALFGIAIIGGVVVLATTKSGNTGNTVPVVVWGTMPDEQFNSAISGIVQGKEGLKITYVEVSPDTFDRNLVEALASGSGPDVILLPQDLILRHKGKILPLPYTSMPLPTFKSTFIQEGELFLDDSGIIAIPFSVDPLIMYWNRDLMTNAGVSAPPKTWDEFITLVPKLTSKDKNLNILKSGLALGEFRNIANAKEILTSMLMQTGNFITTYGNSGLESTLKNTSLGSIGAVNFYTDFSNPVKPDYSWNRSLPNSRDMFTAGNLAIYFGFASELSKIRDKNPNLNFDVTYFPQPKSAPVAITFGRMQGLAVMRNSQNQSWAVKVVTAIVGGDPILRLSQITGLPPVLRSMLNANPSDPYQTIFYNSAVRARAWLDPNPAGSQIVFQNMIESITSGQYEVGRAIEIAGGSLESLAR